jgi:ribokinase
MHDIITIGDAMRDIFIFPSIEEMEQPASSGAINPRNEPYEKYLVFGLGDKITISDVDYAIGGAAANVAIGASKLGLKSALISAIGSDNNGIEIKNALSKNSVSSFLKTFQQRKSSFSVIVSYKGERTIFVYHSFGPNDFSIPAKIDSKWVYLGPMSSNFESLYNKIVAQVVKYNIKVAINPGSVQIKAGLHSFGGLLKLVEIIFLNKEEAIKISGLKGLPTVKDIAKVIQAQGPKVVVVTDGDEGAYCFDGDDFYKIGAYPAKKIEATGAGDAFASAFTAGIIDNEPIRDCLKWGVINSASVIEKYGAQTGLLAKNTIKRRVKEYKWPADTLRFS